MVRTFNNFYPQKCHFNNFVHFFFLSITVILKLSNLKFISWENTFMDNSQFDISGHLLPTVFRSHAWGILHTLLEMFSYRLHHFQPHYRVQLLNHLHSLAAVTQTNQTQLHLWQVFVIFL